MVFYAILFTKLQKYDKTYIKNILKGRSGVKIKNIEELQTYANKIRKDIIEAVYSAGSGHPGGSLSIAEILAVLYFNQMNIDEKNPKAKERDRLVLSKGHTSPALYSALALRGFFEEE